MAVTISFTADASGVTQETAKVSANLSAAFAAIQAQMKQMEAASTQGSTAIVQGLSAITAATQATAQATQVMAQTIQRNSANTSKQFQDTAQQAKSLVQSFDALTNALVGFYAAFQASGILGGFIKDVTLTAARTETLGVVLMQVAKNAGVTALEAGTARDRIKALGVTTQEASSITARFIASNLDLAKAIELANVARNAAVVADQNTSQALNGLVQGILTMQQETLRTYGIFVNLAKANEDYAKSNHRTVESLTTYEKQQIALNAVIAAGVSLNGTYEASLGTVGKQVTSLTRVVEESKNVLGTNYLPIFSRLVQGVTSLLTGFQQLSPAIQTATAAIVGSAAAVGVLTVAIAALVRVGQALAVTSLFTGWGPVILAIAAATAGVIALSKALSSVGETDPAKVLQQSLSGLDSRIATTQNLLKAQESSLAVMQKQLEQTPESKAGAEIIARQTARVEELRVAVEALQKVREQVGKPVPLPPPKPPTETAKVTSTAAAEAAAALQANEKLTREKIEQEKIALDHMQAMRMRALEEDYTAAVANTKQTKAAQQDVETAFALRRLDETRQRVLEETALEERAAIKTRDSQIATIKARDAAAKEAASVPGATAEKQVAADKRSAASAIELQAVTLNAENAKQAAAKKRTEAEAAYEKGVSSVVRGERTEQIKITEAQLERDAKMRQTALQGQSAILSAETELVQAQVDGLVLTREEGLAKTYTIEVRQLAIRRELMEEQFQEELRQLEKRFAANEATEAEITALRADHVKDVQALNIQQQTQAQAHQNQLLQGWIEWVKDVRSALGDFLFRWMSGQVRSMKDVLNELKSWFFRLIADMAAKAATSAIIVPILTAVIGSTGGGGGGLLAQAGAAIGGGGGGGLLGTAGTALSGIGLARQLMSFFGLDSLTGSIKAGLTTLREVLGQGLSDLFSSAATRASQAAIENATAASELGFETTGQVGTGAAATGVSTAATVMGIAGGLAALGAGIYGALNASNNAAKAAYAASAAAGAAAAGIAAYTAIAEVAAPALLGLSATGIGLIVAAVMAVIGTVLTMVIKPAGPNLAVGQPGGIGVGAEGGKLVVQGKATSRTLRGEGVSEAQTNAVQQALNEGITNAVTTIIQTINAVALDPAKLLGPTQEALTKALADVQTINSASAKHMEKDIAEQLRFTTTAFVANMLDPINMAFEQLVDSDLKTQLDRLPVTTIGLVDIFKTLNTQLDDMAKGENRDVLGQIQGTREAVQRFGVRLAQTAGDTSEQIVNGLITQFDDAIERTQPLKLVSDFSHNLATLITTFNERMTDGLHALVTLQKTQQTLEAAGLPGQAVGSQVDRLSAELAQQSEIFSTQIVTRALENLSSALQNIVIQPIQIQATTVDSLFSDSLAALNALWLEWHRLEDAGIDATRIQEQFTKLLGGILESSKTLLTNALQQGTFPEFLEVLLSIPDALAKMNPVFERLKALGQAFAQVVGPIQQAITQREEQLRTPAERVTRTAQQMRDLEHAIIDAGTSAEKALPLYAQLAAAMMANAEAQIAAVQQVGAVIEQMTTILDARLSTSQRLAKVNQQIEDRLRGPAPRPDFLPPDLKRQVPPTPMLPYDAASVAGGGTLEDLSELVTLYGQQLDLFRQLIDAIETGLKSIDETLRTDESVSQRAARLVAATQPTPGLDRIARAASPEELLRQAEALQGAIGAVRELIDMIEQGLQNIQDILHANETVSQRAVRLVAALAPPPGLDQIPEQSPEALIHLAGAIGDAITAVRALIDMIKQGLDQIAQTLHANETVTERAIRLVAAVTPTPGIDRLPEAGQTPEELIRLAGQIDQAITAVRAVIDMLQSGIDSIDSTLFSLLSVAEQSSRLQAEMTQLTQDIIDAGRATPEQLIKLVGLTQQALSVQKQITQALESTLEDLRASIADTGTPASTIAQTRAEIASLQVLAASGKATPEQLQKLVDLNQKLLGLGAQFDLLDVQQEALDALKALEPVIQAQIDASKAREQALINSLVEIKGWLEAQIVVAKSTEEQLLGQLTGIQTLLQGMLTAAQLTEQQLVAQLINVQRQLLDVLAAARSIEAQLIDQLVNVRALLQSQLTTLESAEAMTIRYLDAQLQALNAQLIAQYGTANVDLIVKQIQEWALAELRDLNKRLKDLFLQQPDAQALFGIQTELAGQTTEMGTQTAHLRSMDDELNTVINKLDDVNASLNRPLRTTPAQSGGWLYASLNRAATGPLGYARGGMVSAILEPGERVFPPPFSSSQKQALTAMNTEFPRMGGGWTVPGSGSGDSVPAMLPSGSFVLNRRASGQAGYQGGGVVSGSVSTNHVTINIQVYQQPGQSAREIVELLSKKLRREFRTMNDDSPFK